MEKLIKNKKGDVSSIVTFMVMVFFLAVAFLISAFATNQFKEVITDSALNGTNVSVSSVDHLDRMTNTSIQYGYIAIFSFLIIGMMISSFMVRIHPAFLFIYVIFLLVAIFIGVPLANTYQEVAESSGIVDIASQQTLIEWTMEYMPFILLGVGALSMIITFGKLIRQNGGGL